MRRSRLPRGCARSTPQAEGSPLRLIQVHPQGSVQLQREEPRALWGRATLLAGVCAPPELGRGGSLGILAVMSWPKLVEYLCVLPCARPPAGIRCLCSGLWACQDGILHLPGGKAPP